MTRGFLKNLMHLILVTEKGIVTQTFSPVIPRLHFFPPNPTFFSFAREGRRMVHAVADSSGEKNREKKNNPDLDEK